ncbi:hypothetical protein BJ912DRAFT_535394 [Pholiota molesta]|nr:hypothetical protein BJ912DRAFT_535394 [Pholiota molesta]
MPAYMESPLDVTHPSWYRTDSGTARTIHSGAPSPRSTTTHTPSTTHSRSRPSSPAPSRKSSGRYGQEAPSSLSVSAASSARRARGPRPPPSKSTPDTLDTRTAPALLQDRRPTAGEVRHLATPAHASARDARVATISQSQPRRSAQAARSRPHPHMRPIPAAAGEHDTEPPTRRRARASAPHLPHDARRDHAPPPVQDGADIWQKGDSWYRAAPPKPPGKGRQGRGWYFAVIGMLGAGKA